MSGLGTIVNALAIVGGSLIGLMLKKGLPEKWQSTIISGIGLCVCTVGAQMALKTGNIIVVIISLVIGGIIGEAIDIERLLARLGDRLGGMLRQQESGEGTFTQGFVTASLVFCVGAMAIVGSFQDGLTGDPSTLYAKSALDGIMSVVFTANMGVGVLFSAVPVAIYQGSLTLLAGVLQPLLSDIMVREMTATGGLLIVAIGTNLLNITKVRIGNLLPAILVAVLVAAFL